MSEQGNVDPNLRLGASSRNNSRYPSPFFDVSQQYIPPTIKELFKWVYFYATNNSFIGPALRKMARYPITDLILEDSNHALVERWSMLMNNTLHIKTFNMSSNHDLLTYGNAFVTIHYPFSRFLQCAQCGEKTPWKAIEKKIENLQIKIKCRKCGLDGKAEIIDVPYKSMESVRLVRINPEYIDIKYNDATGRHIYLYSIPDKLKRQIMAGDADILEDTPKIYLDAIRQKKKIKLSNQNLFHLKLPSLAGKDMGWGLPPLSNALKDLFHFYTLRRGQEAVMLEHITPLDIIFPEANGKFDPYVHSDLTNWRREIESQLAKRRRDPNYKAILPFPVGYARISGDGKNMLLTPEIDFLAKSIIGSVGIPQEFVFGGNMQWTGSSISLRTLENDFLHHRSQLLQMNIWLMDRLRVYLNIPTPKSVKFSDFKMADDVQKLQLLIGMASNRKLDWNDIYKEMGKDPKVVRERIREEARFDSELQEQDILVQTEAQIKAQRMQARAQPQPTQLPIDPAREKTILMFAKKLTQQDPATQEEALERLAKLDPEFAAQVQQALQGVRTSPAAPTQQGPQSAPPSLPGAPPAQPMGGGKPPMPGAPQPQQQKKKLQGINMSPMPEQRPPRRAGAI